MNIRPSSWTIVAALVLAACTTPGPTPTTTATSTTVPTTTPIPVLDGEAWIVYGWWLPDHDETDLFLVRPDGSDAHVIAEDIPGEHGGPAWSPDGDRLAFVVRGDDTPTPEGGIWLSDADGMNAAPLLDTVRLCPDGAFWPAWSPDGNRLSITCYVGGRSTLQVLDLATLQMVEIDSVAFPEFLDNPATWSPDGLWLAYDVMHRDPTDSFVDGSLLSVARGDGTDVRRITEMSSFAAVPDWDPNGGRIAFNTYDLGAIKQVPEVAGLYTIAPDGSDLQTLALTADMTLRLARPRWYPDGSMLLANLAHGNPVFRAEIVIVSPSSGTWASLMYPTDGAGPKLRPTP